MRLLRRIWRPSNAAAACCHNSARAATPGDQALQAAGRPARERRVRPRGGAVTGAILPDRDAGEQPPEVARRARPGLCSAEAVGCLPKGPPADPLARRRMTDAGGGKQTARSTSCKRSSSRHAIQERECRRTSSAAACRVGAQSSAHTDTCSARAGCLTGCAG